MPEVSMANDTVRIIARIPAKPEKAAEVRSILLGLVDETRKEKGCISYELLHNHADSGDFTFVEEWANDSVFDAHLATPHVQKALSKAGSLLAGEPDIRRYTALA
jgi:quinol monooxygenase YgiN